MANQKRTARDNFAEKVAWTKELLNLANDYYKRGQYLGGILILLNMIEINIKTLILLLDLEMTRCLRKSKCTVEVDFVKSYKVAEKLSLGRLIDWLEARYQFKEKSEVLKIAREANEIRVFYIHNLTQPEEFILGKRKGKTDFERLSEILDYLKLVREILVIPRQINS